MKTEKVILGVDQLDEVEEEFFGKKRVGLVTNSTGLDSQLNLTIDIFSKKANLTALFGPEHGLWGCLPGGTPVAPESLRGIPVFSLYGKDIRPSAAMLSNVDVIAFDLQDVGSRFYTYISTLKECMIAAAQFKKELVVLDRPNPLGGNIIEGPEVEKSLESFVGCAKIGTILNLFLLIICFFFV